MNNCKIILFAIIIAVSACKNAEKPKNTEGSPSVNSDAAQAFARQFPKAEDVAWDTLETGLSASFFDGTADCKAFFDVKGVFQYTTSFVEMTTLPPSAQRFLKEKYRDTPPAVVLSVKNAQNETFQVELETASDYITIEFDKNGKILKEQKQPLSNEELKRQEEEGVEKN